MIASVTKPFCGDCTRMRLSPEGSIYTCLFSNVGTDLRGPMRSGATDDDLQAIIRGCLVCPLRPLLGGAGLHDGAPAG